MHEVFGVFYWLVVGGWPSPGHGGPASGTQG